MGGDGGGSQRPISGPICLVTGRRLCTGGPGAPVAEARRWKFKARKPGTGVGEGMDGGGSGEEGWGERDPV